VTEPRAQAVPESSAEQHVGANSAVQASAPEEQPAPAAKAVEPVEHKLGTLGIVQWLLSVVVIAAFVMTFILQAFEIPSDSMEKTLLVGDYLLVNKVAYADGGIWSSILPYSKLKRGDIVVFRYPLHPVQHFVKRVIGVPGDRIHLSNKQVFVNGKPLIEEYTIYKSTQRDYYRDDFPNTNYISGNVDSKWWIQMRKLIEDGNLIVPEGHYFVMGDNRDDSSDSRYWGFVPQENVEGRPLLIYWSVERDGDEEEDAENQQLNAKVRRVTNGFIRMFRDARWSRTMTVVH
jgi:signal peptidase I